MNLLAVFLITWPIMLLVCIKLDGKENPSETREEAINGLTAWCAVATILTMIVMGFAIIYGVR